MSNYTTKEIKQIIKGLEKRIAEKGCLTARLQEIKTKYVNELKSRG